MTKINEVKLPTEEEIKKALIENPEEYDKMSAKVNAELSKALEQIESEEKSK